MKKNLFTNLFLGAVFCLAGNAALAQGEYKCGTTQMYNKLLAENPGLAESRKAYNDAIDARIKEMKEAKTLDTNHIVIIPVVFHIIHTNGSENISDAQVIDQVSILNRDYRKDNADTANVVAPFKPLIGDMKIEFRLAQLDPDGMCTNGIDRIYSHKTENANDYSKLNPWPSDRYLNVWVIKTMESVGTAGYAYYPGSADPTRDGIIIIHQYIGSIGTGSVGQSRALTHEVGHWLNLPHCWGSTNDPEVACGDEGVNDTPETAGHDNCGNRFDFECDSKALTGTYTFGSVTTTSGITDPSAVPEATDSAITFTAPVATGVSTNSSSASMFEFSKWDTGALDGETAFAGLTGSINTSKYYQFSITPDLAQALTMTGMTFNVQRNTNGIRTFAVRSNADGYAANLPIAITPANPNLSVQAGNTFFINSDTTISLVGSKITLSGSAFTNINNTTRTFRIYGWNAEDSTGTFGVDNIAFTGTHGIVENVENYMEYSYCSKMFTFDQRDRMRTALDFGTSGRNNLWINSNLLATGTDGSGVTCEPKPDFFANRTMICPGATVTFTKNISNITAGVTTTASWSFPGGTPSSSTAVNPIITYSTPGYYSVTLTATNSGGTGTFTKTNYIYVSDNYAQVAGNFVEDFENPTEFYSNWITNDFDGNSKTWWYSALAGYNSSHSIMMNPYFSYAYDVDNFISPSYNLSFYVGTSTTMTFRCAAASTATSVADMNDKLTVSTSTDCGQSWTIRRTFTGGPGATYPLINNGYHPEEFIPNNVGQWALYSVPVGTGVSAKTRFKFEYTSGDQSNSIFIDDINIQGTVGIEENLQDGNLSIYPNPTSQTATLTYSLIKKGDVRIELVDVLGKKLMEVSNPGQLEGNHTFEISKQDLALKNGVYFVRFSIDNSSVTKKLIISE